MSKRKRRKENNKNDNKYKVDPYSFTPDDELDYHELGVLNHFDIEMYLNQFLEDSHISGYKNLLVIVGKGEVVRPQVKKLLGKHELVEGFKQAGYFNGGDGAFEVTLLD